MSFKNYLQSQGKSKSTIKYSNYYVLDFLSWLDMDGTCPELAEGKEVMSYLSHLQKRGLSDQSRAVRLNALNHFFDYQIEQELREEHPSKHIKIRGASRIKLYPPLTKQQLEQIHVDYKIPTAEDPRRMKNWFTTYRLSKQRNKIILSLLINQGITTAEITKIEVSDLQLRSGEILIKGSRKSNERTLKLKSNQIMDLMEYSYQIRPAFLNYQVTEPTQLFLSTPTPGKTKIQQTTLSVWKKLGAEIRAQHPSFIKFHQIRTSVIVQWLKHYNLREVQYMAGHKHVNTTERYFLNQTEDLLKDIDQFHPLN